MSFGDHLEELRTRMWRALKGLALCLFIGFILDAIGTGPGCPGSASGGPCSGSSLTRSRTRSKQFYADRANAAKDKSKYAREHEDNSRIRRTVELPGSFRPDQFPGRSRGRVKIKGTFTFTERRSPSPRRTGTGTRT